MTIIPVKNKSLISTCIWKNNAVSDSFLCKSKLRQESGLSMYYIHVYTRIWLLLCALLSHIEINDVVSWTVTACFRYGDVTHILVAFNIDVNLCMVLVNINLCFCQKVEAKSWYDRIRTPRVKTVTNEKVKSSLTIVTSQ